MVLKPGIDATAEEIMITARLHLASYQKPRVVEFVPMLPKSASVKILKRELRDACWQQQERKV